MSSGMIRYPLRPQVDEGSVDVHVIPEEEARCISAESSQSSPKKRPRQSSTEEGSSLEAFDTLESLRVLGRLTHSTTSALIRREASDLNRTLLSMQEQPAGKKKSHIKSLPKEDRSLRVATPNSHSDQSSTQECLNSLGVRIQARGNNTNDSDLIVLWRRVHRNKRLAVMLRDFDALHKLLLSEMEQMMTECDHTSD